MIHHGHLIRQATQNRTFASAEMQVLPERPGNGQDIGEQDRTIKAVAADRLQSHFRRCRRIVAKVQKAAFVRAQLPVLWQVSPSLPHQPSRTRPLWLTTQGGKERFFSGGLRGHGYELRGWRGKDKSGVLKAGSGQMHDQRRDMPDQVKT